MTTPELIDTINEAKENQAKAQREADMYMPIITALELQLQEQLNA